MDTRCALLLLVLALPAASQEGEAPVSVAAWTGTVRQTLQRKGTLVPAEADELRLELRVYRGELKLAEIVPHGTFVNKDDVVARLDTRAIDEQIEKDRMALERAEMDFRQAEEKDRMAREAEAEGLERARIDSDRAAKRLRGFRDVEKAIDDEQERLSLQAQAHRLDDQKDELDQLEKMYSEDELVDATEEIVLKRSRRNWARSQQGTDLSERRRLYHKEWYEPWREEDLERDARHKDRNLARAQRKEEMAREKAESDARQRRYDLEKQREKLADLQKDRERLVVRSPRGGFLLHGAADAAPWTARLEPGGTVKADAVFASVASPSRFRAATDIAEGDILRVRPGTAAEVAPVAAPDRKLVGALEVETLPFKEGLFRAEVSMEGEHTGLRPGFAATVHVVLAEQRDAVLVPKSAVVGQGDGAVVHCAATAVGPFVPRRVVTGLDDGSNIAILDGLRAGEFVVRSPAKK